MKLRYSLILFFGAAISLLSPFTAKSQSDNFTCGTDAARRELIEKHPEILLEEERLEEFTRNYLAKYPMGNVSRSGPIIIPIVFHVIHQGGPENISDAQILDQVRILNRDFNLQNTDISLVKDSFLKTVIANVGFEFRLAHIDPQGNCTNGIDRVYSVQTNMGNDYSKLNGWPRDKYMNIWVVNRMRGGAAGYAYYPAGVPALVNSGSPDGVIILHDYVGSIGTSAAYKSRALTHEIGHCMNLKHTWGDTNQPGVACGDDAVDDTPKTKGYQGCPSSDAASMVCTPGIAENYQNYMDYSYCSVMFTEGQKLRMIATLDTNIAARSNLYAPENLIATGVADTPGTPCAPKADFLPSTRYICVNGTVKFTDASLNGTPDTYEWTFPTGAPDVSTEANPTIQFLLPGWQPVTLKVTNQYGTSTKTDNFMIYAGYENALAQAPYYQGFDEADIFTSEAGWASSNVDANNTFFRQTNVPHNGTGSAYLNNYFARSDRDLDEIISPGIDLTTLQKQQMNLSFYYSWASANGNFNSYPDSIAINATTDCGKTWINIYKKSAVAVLGYNQGPWVPGTESGVWKKEEVSMSGGNYEKLHKSNVRFKFQVFSSVGGNNFYIDDINIGFAQSPFTGVEEIATISNFNLFPNPTTGNTNLDLAITKASKVNIKLNDITGKQVQNVYEGQMAEGETRLTINGSNLAKGIYILNITAGESKMQKKLVIQ